MAARFDGGVLPAFLLRLFMAPVALGSIVAAATALLRRRSRQPSLPRMSEEWLRNHPVDYRRDLPW
jgi:hypothetical protein